MRVRRCQKDTRQSCPMLASNVFRIAILLFAHIATLSLLPIRALAKSRTRNPALGFACSKMLEFDVVAAPTPLSLCSGSELLSCSTPADQSAATALGFAPVVTP